MRGLGMEFGSLDENEISHVFGSRRPCTIIIRSKLSEPHISRTAVKVSKNLQKLRSRTSSTYAPKSRTRTRSLMLQTLRQLGILSPALTIIVPGSLIDLITYVPRSDFINLSMYAWGTTVCVVKLVNWEWWEGERAWWRVRQASIGPSADRRSVGGVNYLPNLRADESERIFISD